MYSNISQNKLPWHTVSPKHAAARPASYVARSRPAHAGRPGFTNVRTNRAATKHTHEADKTRAAETSSAPHTRRSVGAQLCTAPLWQLEHPHSRELLRQSRSDRQRLLVRSRRHPVRHRRFRPRETQGRARRPERGSHAQHQLPSRRRSQQVVTSTQHHVHRPCARARRSRPRPRSRRHRHQRRCPRPRSPCLFPPRVPVQPVAEAGAAELEARRDPERPAQRLCAQLRPPRAS
ncbi:hypothetical protein OH77DRAFT_1210780 [Trametes cingulata]|nr:hypothetical protein OH77DRAFT_1210780 [Trametes cingulata]